MDFGLTDRVVVITGASRGLGRALAEQFAQEGASLGLLARNEEDLVRVADRLSVQTVAISCDVADEDQVTQAFEVVSRQLGGIDSVVANAGGQLAAEDAANLPLNKWRETVELNLTGSYITACAAYPYLQNSRSGRMIFVSSGAAKHPLNKMSAYVAAKSGVEGLTRALCVEWSRDQIGVNAVAPGLIDTEGSRRIPSKFKEKILARTSLDRTGTVLSFNSSVLFLAGDLSEFITGQVISVDGGYGFG